MELSDLTTRLPPRKRLLAGLKNPNPNFELEIPIRLASSEIGSRLREIINAPNLSPQEAIEALKSIALAASETAAKARQIAMEKASIADKEKENAQNALEYLDSISENKNGRRVRGSASRVRAKTRVSDTDEEIAKRLHRTMNSSPRICKEKKRSMSCDFADRSSEKTESFEGENEILPKENFHEGNGRKVRIKRKRVLLNQFEDGETESKKRKHTNNFVDCNERKGDSNSNNGLNENKLTSVWRCIKFKTSKCSSDPKKFHSTGSEAPA
ncbi:hypothetical protein LUZ60_002892 [Juncus effusus]|nr:hypothetical protein LUZ60_002892 [Juncus effusus]